MTASESSMAQIARRMLSAKAEQFTESVIREMTRLALKHNAVNLSQGFPDFAAPAEIKEAARQAISDDINQYAVTWGAKPLRDAIVEKFERTQGVRVDPEREITICCGSTEAMMAAMMAVINPGDEIVVFEPFYENYGPDAILSGATPRFVKMRPPADENSFWSYDENELAAAFGPHTKALILNTPNNPTGKVFTRAELEFIRDLCVRWNAYCITDEIYEHILYDGAEHISMARGLGAGSAGTDAADSQGARFPDSGRGRTFATSRRQRDAFSAELLRSTRDFLHDQTRTIAENSHERGIHGVQAAGRVLHHDGYFALRRSGPGSLSGGYQGCAICKIPCPGNRRRRRSRIQLLQ